MKQNIKHKFQDWWEARDTSTGLIVPIGVLCECKKNHKLNTKIAEKNNFGISKYKSKWISGNHNERLFN